MKSLALVLLIVVLGSATAVSAQTPGRSFVPDRASGVAQLERTLERLREIGEYNDRMRDKQERESRARQERSPSGGGYRKDPLSATDDMLCTRCVF